MCWSSLTVCVQCFITFSLAGHKHVQSINITVLNVSVNSGLYQISYPAIPLYYVFKTIIKLYTYSIESTEFTIAFKYNFRIN